MSEIFYSPWRSSYNSYMREQLLEGIEHIHFPICTASQIQLEAARVLNLDRAVEMNLLCLRIRDRLGMGTPRDIYLVVNV
jgi:hypothetical protein